jgi:flagellar basal body-associated protein FliL
MVENVSTVAPAQKSSAPVEQMDVGEKKSKSWLWIAIAVAVVVVVGVVVWFVI